MSVQTRSQKFARAAYARVAARGKPPEGYASFAKKFPALIHTCGLAQAVAFAQAKGKSDENKVESRYLEDLAEVIRAGGHDKILSADRLAETTRSEALSGYLRLSRDAINAAGWLKRYVEASGEGS